MRHKKLHIHTKLDAKELLKKYKLKVTPARQMILDFLSDTHKPVSVEEILTSAFKASNKVSNVKKNNKEINQVTVYRTITSFQKIGIVRPVDIRADAIHYELVEPKEHHHHHIVCTSCGDIEDFEHCNVNSVIKSVMKSSKKFSKANDHSFELFAVCKNCI